MNQFPPQPQSIQLGPFRKFSKIRGDICKSRWQHRWQILPPISLVLLIPVANLSPVSTIPAANCHQYQRHRWQICHWCKRHRWQTMGAISDCWQLEMNMKDKIYLYANSTIQRCPKEIMNFFQIEDFFHLPPVLTTPVVHLELLISPRIFEKIRNGPISIISGLGETDQYKKPEVKNLVALSL